MKIEHLTPGCVLVYSDAKEGILIGAVSEAIKYLQHMDRGDVRIHGGGRTERAVADLAGEERLPERRAMRVEAAPDEAVYAFNLSEALARPAAG